MIPIVKPYLPPIERYQKYVEQIYARNWLTNRGPLLQELEARLCDYLGTNNLMLVANGTLAIQVAIRALGLKSGEVLTTPFTFAATSGALKWQNLVPRFVDIDQRTFNLDTNLLKQDMLSNAKALMPVHVFGNPCDVEALEREAQKASIPVIYDAAHAFGVTHNARSILEWGDAATLSLHATKLFHCVEGGIVRFRDEAHLEKARQLINFGFDQNNMPVDVGINAKMSELHAAMGLAMLDNVDTIVARRTEVIERYREGLGALVTLQNMASGASFNGAYAPVVFGSESSLLKVQKQLTASDIQSRRYFYPNLSECSVYGHQDSCPVSASISRRVLCLPVFFDITEQQVDRVISAVVQGLGA